MRCVRSEQPRPTGTSSGRFRDDQRSQDSPRCCEGINTSSYTVPVRGRYAAFARACVHDFEWYELDAAAPPPPFMSSGSGRGPGRSGETEQQPARPRELKASVRLVRLVWRSRLVESIE